MAAASKIHQVVHMATVSKIQQVVHMAAASKIQQVVHTLREHHILRTFAQMSASRFSE